LVDSIHISTSLVRLPGTKAIDHAAGTAIRMPSMVEPTAMMIEFVSAKG
jgi:hypothetical protein